MVNTLLQMEESVMVLGGKYPVTNGGERGGTGW